MPNLDVLRCIFRLQECDKERAVTHCVLKDSASMHVLPVTVTGAVFIKH